MKVTPHEVLASAAGEVSGKAVVDLGAGAQGTLAEMCARSAPRLAVAVDLNLEALAGRSDGSVSVAADLSTALPFRASAFDVVLSHNTLECLTDPRQFLSECKRVLAPGGRVVLGHTEFDSITINSNDRALCRRVLRTYCELPVLYRFMQQADSQMGRRLTGLLRNSGFAVMDVIPHVKVELALGGDAEARIAEIAWSVRRAVSAGATDLTEADVETWLNDLTDRDAGNEFFFSETAYMVVARASP